MEIIQDRKFYLEEVFQLIGFRLQMPDYKYENAKEKLENLHSFLENKVGEEIYTIPQGSFKLNTTVKPLKDENYDIDFITILPEDDVNKSINAQGFFDFLSNLFKDSEVYKEKIEYKKRSIRINYSGDFHVDILPAKYRYNKDTYDLLVPDLHVQDFVRTNPKGYADWFDTMSKNYDYSYRKHFENLNVRSELEELEGNEPFPYKSPLKRSVQLIKRARDMYFKDDNEFAPSSILLTTLFGKYYNEYNNIFDSLLNTLLNIELNHENLDASNPSLPEEDFKEKWTRDKNYEIEFKKFIDYIIKKLHVIKKSLEEGDMRKVRIELKTMFGENIVDKTIDEHREKTFNSRKMASNSFLLSIIGLNSAKSLKAKDHTFYGS